MGSEAQREMTLAEWVDRLPEIHGARKELSALIAAAERADAAEKRVRELEDALQKIATCVTSPASPDYLSPVMAKQLARTALGKEGRT